MDFAALLDKYAEITVQVGLNVQPNQLVIIRGSIECADYIRAVARKAYDAGARHVQVIWSDEQISRLAMERETLAAVQEVPAWLVKAMEDGIEANAAVLSVSSPNPDLFKGIDPEKLGAANKAAGNAMKRFSAAISASTISWCVVAAPTEAWAAKVFPDLTPDQRVAKLWATILAATRITTANPLEAWQEQLRRLNAQAQFLNGQQFKKLHYRAPGTDLTIELPEGHLWISVGGNKNAQGTPFSPNLPSEEVFTAPAREGVNGTVRATLPLNYSGTLIENLNLTFDNGRIVKFSADSGYEALKNLISTDEGSHYLGEVALVPVESPINQTGILFYNTLFDENASCHLAIGRAYPTCLEGGTSMTEAEQEQRGLNHSITHVDFMVGSANLDIDGITASGEVVPVFRQGTWATRG